MSINPVLFKELWQPFRKGKAPWILFIYLLVLGGFTLGFIYLNWRHAPMTFNPSQSQEIFAVLSVAQLILLAFVTPGLTAGTISGERERQTLDVLLITDLSPRGIVISKLVSSCAFTLLLVVATFPLYSMVLMFGGIAPAQLLSMFGFYLVTMYLFASIGMACSAFFKRTGISTITSYGITALLGAGTAFLAVFIREVTRNIYAGIDDMTFPVQFLLDINPVFALLRIMGEGPLLGQEANWVIPYWGVYLIFYLGVGTLLLLWSGRRLNPLGK
ncbi:MAG: ABC transporter permease [Firmicutes bacterium]|nr:ABC transporter permease [Bacillota bacterium]